jgi:hypothetical protein
VSELRGSAMTESFRPAFGRELIDALLGMGGGPQQDVLQMVERRNTDERAALDERI